MRVDFIILTLFVIALGAYQAYLHKKQQTAFKKQIGIINSETNKLKQQDTLKTSVIESITDMIFTIDKYGVILIGNSALLKALGMNESEVKGKNYRDVFKIFEVDSSGNFQSEYDPLLTDEYKLYFAETPSNEPVQRKLIGKGGQVERHISVSASPLIHSQDSEQGGAVLVMKDLTEARELERMKLDFVSMAAHELRTPITAIRGYLSVLKEEATSLSAEHQTFIERVDIAAQQLANLMENLLSVSRIEKGTYTLNLSEVAWPKLVKERTDEFKSRAKTYNIELKLTVLQQEIPPVFVDPLRIMEVMNNLLSNALNYTKHGSVEVIVEYDEKKEAVITHIKDTGQGIPKEAQTHLFEKFFRVSGVLEQGSKGTGLGLFISKKIVELHNGSIWAESAEGKGSTFSFSLPIASKAHELHQKTAVIPGKVYMAPPITKKQQEERVKMPL